MLVVANHGRHVHATRATKAAGFAAETAGWRLVPTHLGLFLLTTEFVFLPAAAWTWRNPFYLRHDCSVPQFFITSLCRV